MSNIAPQRHNFIVYAPDMTDEGALQRRLNVRAKHLERAKVEVANGVFKVAGAMLTPESIESPTAQKKMIGSVFVCEAESLGEVRKLIEGDVYYTSGVWDKDKLVILPLALATQLP
ncbi:hypothetical protein C2E23DRAFT_866627 [Lenzites betulinus]|nr:hypothetical protein C2E23DRAFT_866627 [Lenzites betulinus]